MSVLNELSIKVIERFAEEMNKPEMQQVLKYKLITPLTSLIYREIYPYIMVASITIFTIFLITLLTFICFVLYYLKRR